MQTLAKVLRGVPPIGVRLEVEGVGTILGHDEAEVERVQGSPALAVGELPCGGVVVAAEGHRIYADLAVSAVAACKAL